MAQHKKSRRKKQKLTIGQSILLLIACVAVGFALRDYLDVTPAGAPATTPISSSAASQTVTGEVQTEIHTIDVGQGDATLLRQGAAWCLIDAGTKASADELVEYLKNAGVERLDYVIMTHAHADHIGGMPEVLANFPVDHFILPDFSLTQAPTTAIFKRTLEALDAQTECQVLTASVGTEFALNDATLTIVGAGIQTNNQNNTSVCTLFSANGVRYLNTGDAEKECEDQMVAMGISLKADIFKAAHHGSRTANTAPLLEKVAPSFIVVSCGKDNDYGHPHDEAMQRFVDTGAQVLRTDELGTVVFTVSDGVLSLKEAA